MPEDIFSKIVAKEVPAAIVYEDAQTMAFLDIMPVNTGHCLVIPKKKYATLTDVPDAVAAAMIQTAKKVATALKKALHCDGYNIVMNNHAVAGQVVAYAHIHVIPRFHNDGQKIEMKSSAYAEGQMDEVRKRITTAIK